MKSLSQRALLRARTRFAREPGAVSQELFDGNRLEARIDGLAKPREDRRQHCAERRGERQPSSVDKLPDADRGDGFGERSDARRRCRVHAAESERRYQPALVRDGDAGGGDVILRHPLPERGVQGRWRRMGWNTRLRRDAQQRTQRRTGDQETAQQDVAAGRKGGAHKQNLFRRPSVCRRCRGRGSLDPGRWVNKERRGHEQEYREQCCDADREGREIRAKCCENRVLRAVWHSAKWML